MCFSKRHRASVQAHGGSWRLGNRTPSHALATPLLPRRPPSARPSGGSERSWGCIGTLPNSMLRPPSDMPRVHNNPVFLAQRVTRNPLPANLCASRPTRGRKPSPSPPPWSLAVSHRTCNTRPFQTVPTGRHVEGGVPHLHPCGGNARALEVGHLLREGEVGNSWKAFVQQGKLARLSRRA